MTNDPLIHPEQEAEPAVEPGPTGLRRLMRYVGYPAAIGMLGLSIWLAVKGGSDQERSGFDHLMEASVGQIASMLSCVVVSIILNGYVFYVMLKPFEHGKPVGLFTMTKLIAATSLLNYLPMRAGMVGRAAYLKEYHGVGYRLSLFMLCAAAGFTIITFFIMMLLNAWRGVIDAVWVLALAAILLSIAMCLPKIVFFVGGRFPGFSGIDLGWFKDLTPLKTANIFAWLWARVFDVLINATRLYIVVQVLGKEISFIAILTFAIGGMFVTLVTPLPNGLGLRELIYGLLSSAGLGGETMATLESGIMLGLVDRAIEAIVFITMGLLSVGVLHWRSQKSD